MDAGIKVSVKGVSKRYPVSRKESLLALDDINLDIRDGEFFTLIGASGCGKTSLLRIIAGLEDATEGCVEIQTRGDGGPVSSTVFQDNSIFPWLDVQSNVEYGLKIRGVAKSERRDIADHFIAKVRLERFRHAYPSQLSGGMRQRVCVARAFANGPEILLMDEPFGALDEQTRILLQEEVLRLWSEHRRTVVFVTHSLDEAIALSDRVAVLAARPGRVNQIVKVDIPRPRNVIELRADPHYADVYQMLWNLIRLDVEQKGVAA
jgi:NitT/TauT family transport system ATP-binding protein